jgi:succinyl-CoA synthetase beta subunit
MVREPKGCDGHEGAQTHHGIMRLRGVPVQLAGECPCQMRRQQPARVALAQRRRLAVCAGWAVVAAQQRAGGRGRHGGNLRFNP